MITNFNEFRKKTLNEGNASLSALISKVEQKIKHKHDSEYTTLLANIKTKEIGDIEKYTLIQNLEKKFDKKYSTNENHMDFGPNMINTPQSLIKSIANVDEEIHELDNDGSVISALEDILDKYCGPYDTKYDGLPLETRLEDCKLSVETLTTMLDEITKLKNTISSENNSPHNTVKLRDALQSLLKQPDQTFIDMYIKGYNLHSGGASKPEQDPKFLERMVAESRSDIKYALSEFEEFYEAIPAEHFDKLISDTEKLMSGVAAFANGNNVMDYVYLGESSKYNKKMNIIKESKFNDYVTDPSITSIEQLTTKISSNVQKAMNVFVAQNKLPQLTVTFTNNKLKATSKAFEGDELGVFKNSLKSAQLGFFGGGRTETSTNNKNVFMFQPIIWTDLNLSYEGNGLSYYLDINDHRSSGIYYNIMEAKFYTAKDFLSLNEKKVTGYNTKRK